MNSAIQDARDLEEHLTDPRENHRRRIDQLPGMYWARKRLHDQLHHSGTARERNSAPDYIAAHVRMWS
jgi:hypothetical protein